jgi:hypothetical protein
MSSDLRPSQSGAEGPSVPVFERPPALVQFLDQTEDAIRLRLAELRFFDRVFLLQRDWMTRITMLMLIAGLFWGAVGGFDAFGLVAVAAAVGAVWEMSYYAGNSALSAGDLGTTLGIVAALVAFFVGGIRGPRNE